jgi:hypothetical protein
MICSPVFPRSDLDKMTIEKRQALAKAILNVLQTDAGVRNVIRDKVKLQLDEETRGLLRLDP